MLVLSRNYGESIIIDENISLTYLGKRRGEYRFGINAPLKILKGLIEERKAKFEEIKNASISQ